MSGRIETELNNQLASMRSRMSNISRRTREEGAQLQQKAVMVVVAGAIGHVEGTETRTAQPSGLRIGGLTPAQVIGLAGAAVEIMSDDKDTKNIAGGAANAGIAVAVFQMMKERAAQAST